MNYIRNIAKKVPGGDYASQAASAGYALLAGSQTGQAVTKYSAAVYSRKLKPIVGYAKKQYAILETGYLPLTKTNIDEFNARPGRVRWRDVDGFVLVEVESVPDSDELDFSDAHFVTLSDYARSFTDASCSNINTSLHSRPLSDWHLDSEAPTLNHWDEWDDVVNAIQEASSRNGSEDVSESIPKALETAKKKKMTDKKDTTREGVGTAQETWNEKSHDGHILPQSRAEWKHFGKIAKEFLTLTNS
ncbi:hypothetical protein BDV96DRAFT_691256 [Lophiotrema nucula]|uniref:Uncharacterized protein n=1 Tax=Lophiotrema nucula TaxID=690887 RepID=A0A6A5YTZ5_9PLEO|nr:hypothetical protein BDV96DRAFT_691256 [Lophiotrema nucula]